jgi:DNA-binding transcriptional regulator LsrR (DeoR family)
MTTKQEPTYVPGPVRGAVLELYRSGMAQADIARALKITPQRVGQHIAELRKRGIVT